MANKNIIKVPREMLVKIDSILSLVAHRFIGVEIPEDIIQEMKDISYSVRVLYDKKENSF